MKPLAFIDWLGKPGGFDGSPAERAVLVCLYAYADTRGQCYPSVATIAEAVGMSHATAKRVVKALVKRGVIERTHRHDATGRRYTSNLYRLRFGGVNMTLGVGSYCTGGGVKLSHKGSPLKEAQHEGCRNVGDGRKGPSKAVSRTKDADGFWAAGGYDL